MYLQILEVSDSNQEEQIDKEIILEDVKEKQRIAMLP
jgi:hypothetical protein